MLTESNISSGFLRGALNVPKNHCVSTAHAAAFGTCAKGRGA
ncbi:hypothetical protein BSIN_0870 [Burkholderia singularis]|uniref:Uncharacterized protein n=1 Tax=Burkholderia singularis TaxID=1503053 RepID=A0A238HAP1_9BURK|nr:hypothetical protein BSIN_0870 [Burkholderia singularis]